MRKLEEDNTWEEITNKIYDKIKDAVGNEHNFKKWMLERNQIGYCFDYYLIARAYNIWRDLNRDKDHFVVIAGKEGLGKTTLGFQLCSLVNPSHTLEMTPFSSTETIHALRDGKQQETILIDEGGMNLFSREAMTLTNRLLTKAFMVMRQKNMLITICIPNFFLIDNYIRNHRVDTLLQITERGKYNGYTGKAIRIISQDGRRYMQVSGIRVPDGTHWQGYFNKSFPPNIDTEKYLIKKKIHMDLFLNQMEEDVLDIKFIPLVRAARETSTHTQTLTRLIQKGQLQGKKIADKWYITKESYNKLMLV